MEYENLCRTCLQLTKTDAFELTDCMYKFLTQDLGINRVPKEHPNLRLPQIICSKCESRIIEFQEFLKKCREAETFFNSKLESLSVPNNNDDLEPQTAGECCEFISIEPLNQISYEEASTSLECQEETLDSFVDVDESSIMEISSSDSETVPIVNNNTKQVQYPKNRKSRRVCNVCGVHCKNITALRDHENMHQGIKPYCCEVCGKCFTQRSTLYTHQVLHFGKQVECEECGKKFARKSELIQHDRMHNNEKPFECDVEDCKAKFRQRIHLLEHLAKHTGVRNFHCDICDHSFYTQVSLRHHKDKTHPKFSYQCDICLSWFPLPSYIRKHMVSKHKIQIEDVLHLKKARNPNALSAVEDVDSQ